MTKNEYTAAIEADLTAANALCAELRTLRNFKKIAQTITDADKMVSFETLDKAITGKESELQKLRSTLGKNRRIVKKLEEIEAIETGTTQAPKSKKSAAKKKDSGATAKKSTEMKNDSKDVPTSKQAGKREASGIEKPTASTESTGSPAA